MVYVYEAFMKSLNGGFKVEHKQYEEMSIEELKAVLFKMQKNLKPIKYPAGADGVILLDPNNPNDREWYENDEDYVL